MLKKLRVAAGDTGRTVEVSTSTLTATDVGQLLAYLDGERSRHATPDSANVAATASWPSCILGIPFKRGARRTRSSICDG